MPQEFKYAVTGEWPFPTDMLRRDRSAGASDQDKELIAVYSGETLHNAEHPDTVTIHLAGPDRPMVERWKSFGWEVVWDDPWAMPSAPDMSELEALRDSALEKLTSDELAALKWYFGSNIH